MREKSMIYLRLLLKRFLVDLLILPSQRENWIPESKEDINPNVKGQNWTERPVHQLKYNNSNRSILTCFFSLWIWMFYDQWVNNLSIYIRQLEGTQHLSLFWRNHRGNLQLLNFTQQTKIWLNNFTCENWLKKVEITLYKDNYEKTWKKKKIKIFMSRHSYNLGFGYDKKEVQIWYHFHSMVFNQYCIKSV